MTCLLFLTREELSELTRRIQPAAQARWLTQAGWKFVRDSDGYPVVAREEFVRNMVGGGRSLESRRAEQPEFEVDLAALRELSTQSG
jgi:hypothetical protein